MKPCTKNEKEQWRKTIWLDKTHKRGSCVQEGPLKFKYNYKRQRGSGCNPILRQWSTVSHNVFFLFVCLFVRIKKNSVHSEKILALQTVQPTATDCQVKGIPPWKLHIYIVFFLLFFLQIFWGTKKRRNSQTEIGVQNLEYSKGRRREQKKTLLFPLDNRNWRTGGSQ